MRPNDRVTVQVYPFILAAAGVQTAPAAPGNPSRQFLIIQNQTANPIFVDFGKPATASSFTIAANSMFVFDQKIPIDSINLFSPLGSNGVIVEGLPAPEVKR